MSAPASPRSIAPSELPPTVRALLAADPAVRAAELDASIVDVSGGEGVPIGTLGSGHSVFGRSGFQRLAFAGPPAVGPDFSSLKDPAPFAFLLFEDEGSTVLAERAAPAGVGPAGAATMGRVHSYAELPKAHFRFERAELELGLVMTAFSPLIAHDLEASSTPVQVFDFTLKNESARTRTLELALLHAEALSVEGTAARHLTDGGEVAFAAVGGHAAKDGVRIRLELGPGELASARFFIAWHYPEFRTPSPVATASYRRYYSSRFVNALAVLELALERADAWSQAIDEWRACFDVPASMKRLWFSSLSSVVSSTMLSDDPYFFAIEVPHDWVNTMDVAVYANWVYLVNWPELERWDLEQYFSVIPAEGPNAGFVWHSLWSDAAHYAEEPTFIARLFRAYLWLGDRALLERGYEHALSAARFAHTHGEFEDLLTSKKGNQSYDEWMMPGASAYVNVAWLYALDALSKMAVALGRTATVAGTSAEELTLRVRESLKKRLWTDELGGYFRCFFRTPDAEGSSLPETVFTDQLFGRWVALSDRTSDGVLAPAELASSLEAIYENNLIEDGASGFRGWANGMLPGNRPDTVSGYHARTAWLGAELDLASLLAAEGLERESLDVFDSVERSLSPHHLCVGEWNRGVDGEGRVVLIEDWGKDTPRFPPYPRYTSSWEYLARLVGLRLDAKHVWLRPLRNVTFELREVLLAGVRLSLRVEAGWTRVLVDGVAASGELCLLRSRQRYRVECIASWSDGVVSAPSRRRT